MTVSYSDVEGGEEGVYVAEEEGCVLDWEEGNIAEDPLFVKKAHNIKLRKSGPIFQGEMEIEVSEDMTIKDFRPKIAIIIDDLGYNSDTDLLFFRFS